ncbi:methyltransferase [Streptomyces albidoflavus]|uniref:methyltransferase n=1 Tax=Streptomyces albidoflavus TaxID=1886 RepID=UPI003D11CB40
MGRLSKEEAKRHNKALELAALDRDLTEDEQEFVLDHFREAATATHGLDGAYFTPPGLARALSIEVSGDRIIDLCAGIGRLAWSCRDHWGRRWNGQPAREIVCVERNPEYVRIGRKVLPEATWICADIFDLPDLGHFDTAISNPPFGAIARDGNSPTYSGHKFEYHVISVAAGLARFGAFIIPQHSAPFRYSGEPFYREERDRECLRFEEQTHIALGPNAGVDTSIYRDEWNGVSPRVEVVVAGFEEVPAPPQRVDAPRDEKPAVASAPRPITDVQLPEQGQLDLFA